MGTNSFLSDFARALWGKATPTHKFLWQHMVDSGMCAEALASDWRFRSATEQVGELLSLSFDEAVRLIAFIAAIHDCYGKAHPAFQKKSECDATFFSEQGYISSRDKAERYRHERYGEKRFHEHGAGLLGISDEVGQIVASAIGLHHQGKTGHSKNPIVKPENWTSWADELLLMARDLFQPPFGQIAACKHCDACVMLLTSFTVLADWIASSEPFDSLAGGTIRDYAENARNVAQETIAQYGLHSETGFPQVEEYHQLWPFLRTENLRSVQKAIAVETWPDADLTIIEAPMGEGKTEAGAFYAARMCHLRNKQGLYFALPTSATSNQMHGRIYEMLAQIQRDKPRLMHGMAWLVQNQQVEKWGDDDPEQHESWDWLRPMRRAMLAENGVGTVDQAMMAALHIRYSCLRMLGLTGKVLVIDEIHAYDAYMSSIIEKLVQWCVALHVPVVMLSATLTEDKRKALVTAAGAELLNINQAYPLITQVRNGEARQLEVSGTAKSGCYHFEAVHIWDDPSATAARALQKVANGGCLCVMLNTVSDAQRVYREIVKNADEQTQVCLFHARMKAKHRDAIEKHCVELFGKNGAQRPERAVLVCTQVVEQSMDLDFDGMISCLAPIDLLLQRAGRVHRHERSGRPPNMGEPIVEVLVPDTVTEEAYGANGKVYHPWLLMQTQRLLPITVAVPDGIRSAIEHVYAAAGDGNEAWARKVFSDKLQSDQAKACELPEPDPDEYFGWNIPDGIFELEEQDEAIAAKTRLSEPTVRIALLTGEELEKALDSRPSTAVAQMVLMNSFTVMAKPQETEGMLRGNGLLRDVVLIREDSLPVRIGERMLDYDEILGASFQRRESQ